MAVPEKDLAWAKAVGPDYAHREEYRRPPSYRRDEVLSTVQTNKKSGGKLNKNSGVSAGNQRDRLLIQQKVLQAIEKDIRRPGQIEKAIGHSMQLVIRALELMREEGLVKKSGGDWYVVPAIPESNAEQSASESPPESALPAPSEVATAPAVMVDESESVQWEPSLPSNPFDDELKHAVDSWLAHGINYAISASEVRLQMRDLQNRIGNIVAENNDLRLQLESARYKLGRFRALVQEIGEISA